MKMTNFNQTATDNRPEIPTDLLTQIARDHLDISTLKQQGRDALDFHEVSVWSLSTALLRAYEAGRCAAPAPSSARRLSSEAGKAR